MAIIRHALMLGAAPWHAAASLAREASTCCLVSMVTSSIPWTGTTTTSTTVTPCSGPATVIVETPLVIATRASTTSSESTVTPTVTPGGPCQIKPGCVAAGFSIDSYANPFGGYGRRRPSSYYLADGLCPIRSSLTNTTFFPQDYPPNLPEVTLDPTIPDQPYFMNWTRETNGGIIVDANNFTLVYSGFYRAPATGTYQLCASADNEDDIFFGNDNAFSCTDGRPSADAEPLVMALRNGTVNEIKCTKVSLIKGQSYPIRNVMGNWSGPSAFNFTIQEPDVNFGDRKNSFAGEAYPHDCGRFV